MQKRLTVTVSLSTNPDTAHIGRYFVDIRDTSRIDNPNLAHAGRQMRTFIKDAGPAKVLIGQIRDEAAKQDVEVRVVDNTCDNLDL